MTPWRRAARPCLLIVLAGLGCDARPPSSEALLGAGSTGTPAPAVLVPTRTDRDEQLAPLNGYPARFSIAVGERVFIHYATELGDAHPFLIGYRIHDLLDQRIVKRVDFQTDWPRVVQQRCASWHGDGCNYPTGLALETDTLPPGTYYVILRDFVGRQSPRIYFNLRPPPNAPEAAPVIVLYPTFTYAAYSRFGGGSLYGPALDGGLYEASLHRPIPYHGSTEDAYNSPESVACFAARLRTIGVPYVALSSLDLHEHPEYLDRATLLLLGPHDEYWSRNIADAVHGFLDRGGRVAALGGAVQAWQVEVLPAAIRLDRRAGDAGAARTRASTGRFTAPWINRPPEARFGLSRDHGGRPLTVLSLAEARKTGLFCEVFEQSGGVRVAGVPHPIFAGTGLGTSDVFGAMLEVLWRHTDGIPLMPDDTVDYGRAPRAARDLRVLAHTLIYRDGESPPAERIGVVAETRHPTGGIAVHFGSYGWFRSVCSGDDVGLQIFDNTMHYLLNTS